MGEVQVPSGAVGGSDIAVPTTTLLRSLSLLPEGEELARAGRPWSAITGPPDSVSLIEAGATAANKWWSAGLGAVVVAAWTAVSGWWGTVSPQNQETALWAAAIVTAAALLGIAYLLGSDVRGRAAVATETVRARAAVAESFVRAVGAAPAPPRAAVPAGDGAIVTPLPAVPVRNITKAAADEKGWRALAVRTDGAARVDYLVAKDASHEWVPASGVRVS